MLLVAVAIAGEDDAAVVAVPDEAGVQRPRHLAVTHLSDFARGQIHDIQLDAPALVPVEGEALSVPRGRGEIEAGQTDQFFEWDATGHGVFLRFLTVVTTLLPNVPGFLLHRT